MFFARLYGLSGHAAKRRIDELFKLFELEELARRRYAELSTGNKQRLSVARAMLASPRVLLLDEPTRSLDPLAAARMRSMVKSLAQSNDNRVTVFLTSHNLAEVEELCDRVAIISKGEIRALDTPRNLRTMHTQDEQVTVTFSSLGSADAEQSLARAFCNRFFSIDNARGGECAVKFTRQAEDEILDGVLRVLQQSGAIIRSVEIERASLLDVLESYEAEGSEQ